MSGEILKTSGERSVEASNAAGERLKQLENLETKGEQSPEQKAGRVNEARVEAENLAHEAVKESHDSSETSAGAAHRVAFASRKSAYTATMRRIRGDMSSSAKAFSKFIHVPIVEKSSEIIGGTLARPNAVLAGSTSALIVVLALYVVARTYGYRLSGFETIGAFALGWVIGLIYDYVRVMALGRRS